MSSTLRDDIGDVIAGFRKLLVAGWLASEDIRARYARTALGPWWNILSTVAFIFALTITFGALFRQPTEQFLPYLAAGVACWNFMSGILLDAPQALVRHAGIVQSYPLPLTTQVLRLVADKTILFGHFMIVYAVIALVVRVPFTFDTIIWFLPALAIYMVAAVGAALGLSVVGARFRDVGPAIATIMTMLFLITPVFWQKPLLTADNQWIVDYNPFFHLLEIGRAPLLGMEAAPEHWVASIGIAAGSLILGFAAFAALRRKIYYWL